MERQAPMVDLYRAGSTCRRVFTTSSGVMAVWVGPQAGRRALACDQQYNGCVKEIQKQINFRELQLVYVSLEAPKCAAMGTRGNYQ